VVVLVVVAVGEVSVPDGVVEVSPLPPVDVEVVEVVEVVVSPAGAPSACRWS